MYVLDPQQHRWLCCMWLLCILLLPLFCGCLLKSGPHVVGFMVAVSQSALHKRSTFDFKHPPRLSFTLTATALRRQWWALRPFLNTGSLSLAPTASAEHGRNWFWQAHMHSMETRDSSRTFLGIHLRHLFLLVNGKCNFLKSRSNVFSTCWHIQRVKNLRKMDFLSLFYYLRFHPFSRNIENKKSRKEKSPGS